MCSELIFFQRYSYHGVIVSANWKGCLALLYVASIGKPGGGLFGEGEG